MDEPEYSEINGQPAKRKGTAGLVPATKRFQAQFQFGYNSARFRSGLRTYRLEAQLLLRHILVHRDLDRARSIRI
jgi:hypothetical protein